MYCSLLHRVLDCGSDHYAILRVSKTADEVEIKKAYKKLALQLHPDKNHAPKSDDAFKGTNYSSSKLTVRGRANRYRLSA